MGRIGALLAVLGVVAAPITSGDTAYRSARLIVADFLHLNQKKIFNRLLLALPLFAISAALVFVDFDILWRYFGWVNQTLAVFTLWAVTVWMARNRRNFYIPLVPALWMTMVCSSYIFVAPNEGFGLLPWISYTIGGLTTIACLVCFIRFKNKLQIK
jgi:carbon starvation protein CstA